MNILYWGRFCVPHAYPYNVWLDLCDIFASTWNLVNHGCQDLEKRHCHVRIGFFGVQHRLDRITKFKYMAKMGFFRQNGGAWIWLGKGGIENLN